MMASQPMPSETILVLTSDGIKFPQIEKPKPIDQRQDSLKKYLKAEVKVLGTLQILCGVMVLSVGLILVSAPFSRNFTPVFSILLKAVYPFVGVLCFIISGSLSIITEKKSTKSLVRASLVANILSSLSALEGLILLSVNLPALGPASQQCYLEQKDAPNPYHFFYPNAAYECYLANVTLTGLLSVMLIFTVLEFFLAGLAIVLWWKQSHSDFPGRVLFLPWSCKNDCSMLSEARGEPGYEELLTS
ncbi:membrane-spanning 4-domains subfamily A member 6A-like isoform X3 [Choloepus didactylus]|nr:membrane-spanning 4-domains subfamily A member 6A-like isoform X3 [Choloepus didactylus]XP_037696159.1 membrane-spanning 4-domains subfamily A member 6A-like isoform X3 [Choloepus didactylus]XP_037696160.1 membrane-spanning 4-domains subfamily A member 6A-like isoform X3 [Choloepus didactylus]